MKKSTKKGKNKREYTSIIIVTFIGAIGILLGLAMAWKLGANMGFEGYLIPDGGEDRPLLSPVLFVGRTARAYEAAREIPDVMDKMWCYCDCARHSGHRSLKTCFINRHAAYCDICLLEALKTKELYDKGYSIKEIRLRLHTRFSR